MHQQEEIVINPDYSVFKWPHFPAYLSSDHYVPPDFVLPYWKSDSTKMSMLKTVLGYSYNHHNMTDDDVVERVKHMLADGSAILVKKRKFFHPELRFDGRKLYWIDVGSVRKSWRAVSGRPRISGQNISRHEGYWPLAGRKMACQAVALSKNI